MRLIHDRNTGVQISEHKAKLLKEIEHQLTLGPEGLNEEDKFLLECNFDDIIPQQESIRDTGCWVFRWLERQYACATKIEKKRDADHRNARDGHKTNNVLPSICSTPLRGS